MYRIICGVTRFIEFIRATRAIGFDRTGLVWDVRVVMLRWSHQNSAGTRVVRVVGINRDVWADRVVWVISIMRLIVIDVQVDLDHLRKEDK